LGQILRGNLLTPFNMLLVSLALAVMAVARSPFNVLFIVAAVVNSVVGIFQELKARRTLDKLAILTRPQAQVIRDGLVQEIAIEKVVEDDLIQLNLGDQVVADGEIIVTSGLEIDESLLTGESEPIAKKIGDKVLSGSIVVAGSGVMHTTAVGAQSYSAKLTAAAKEFHRADSELVRGTNRLLKWIAWSLVVVGPILLVSQLGSNNCTLGTLREVVDDGLTHIEAGELGSCDPQAATLSVAAGVVGMIPEGLVLLTSAAFMLAAIQLARRRVLVQQLPAVETLARVDTLLLDKTGTLTEGKMF
jgi:cation-transporting ATPase E